jgi:2-keto-3-deoxy-L-rhamnonate aldolase RhmA
MAPIVRPGGNRPEIIAPFQDRGAWGVQVPHVNTAEEARAAVGAVKYAPATCIFIQQSSVAYLQTMRQAASVAK